MTEPVVRKPSQSITSHQPIAGALKRDTVGTGHIVAVVVAAAAPVAAAVSLIPLGMLLGDGIGMPGAIVLIAISLAIFAAGYVKVVPHIRNAGAFYAYISAGLGRSAGLTSAYVLSLSYIIVGASLVGGFSYFGTEAAAQFLHLDVPWIVPGVVAVLVSTGLTVRGVAVTARVLFLTLCLELLAMGVLNAAVLFHNGFPAFSLAVFNPSRIFRGSIGVTAIYALSLFMGFEGTAIYSEEAKNPQRTIPRATFCVIGLVAVFNAISGWAMVAATGTGRLLSTLETNPGRFVFDISDRYVGSAWTDLIMLLNLLSLFAGILAFQNMGARYLYALARDGMLPRPFASTTTKRGTPWVGLIIIGTLFALTAIAYWAGGLDALLGMSTSLVGMGTVGLLAMLTIVSFSIGVFFVRRRQRGMTTTVAPFVAALLLGYCVVASTQNYRSITGVHTWWINNLPWLFVPVVVGGFGYAFWVRSHRKQAYARIGTTHV